MELMEAAKIVIQLLNLQTSHATSKRLRTRIGELKERKKTRPADGSTI